MLNLASLFHLAFKVAAQRGSTGFKHDRKCWLLVAHMLSFLFSDLAHTYWMIDPLERAYRINRNGFCYSGLEVQGSCVHSSAILFSTFLDIPQTQSGRLSFPRHAPSPNSSVPNFFPRPVWNWSDNSSTPCEDCFQDAEMHISGSSGPLWWSVSSLHGLKRMAEQIHRCPEVTVFLSRTAWSVQPSRCPWTARRVCLWLLASWNDLHEYKNCCSSVFRKCCVIIFRNSIFFLFFELNLAFSFGHLISSWSQCFLHPLASLLHSSFPGNVVKIKYIPLLCFGELVLLD